VPDHAQKYPGEAHVGESAAAPPAWRATVADKATAAAAIRDALTSIVISFTQVRIKVRNDVLLIRCRHRSWCYSHALGSDERRLDDLTQEPAWRGTSSHNACQRSLRTAICAHADHTVSDTYTDASEAEVAAAVAPFTGQPRPLAGAWRTLGHPPGPMRRAEEHTDRGEHSLLKAGNWSPVETRKQQ